MPVQDTIYHGCPRLDIRSDLLIDARQLLSGSVRWLSHFGADVMILSADYPCSERPLMDNNRCITRALTDHPGNVI